MFNYSWVRGTPIPLDFSRLVPGKFVQYADNDMHGAAMQFTYIMQKRMGFKDADKFAMPAGWFPYVLYSHIPLMDYMNGQMPMPTAACPEDKWLLTVQRDYSNVEASGMPMPPVSGDSDARWRFPFRMSYTVHSSHYSPDKVYNSMENIGGGGVANKRAAIIYAANNAVYMSDGVGGPEQLPTGSLGQRRMTDIRFPQQKTVMSDEFGRHFGRLNYYFADPQCRQPLSFYDGSVRVYMTSDTNPGWSPARETDRKDMTKRFSWFEEQGDFDPVMANSSVEGGKVGYRAAAGWFQMTRGGLRGWDVPRGGIRAKVTRNGTLEAVAENELDTSITAAY